MAAATGNLAEGQPDTTGAPDYRRMRRTTEDTSDAGATTCGYVHSYEVGSTRRRTGHALRRFLTGCLLRCQYCHNPDTWHQTQRPPVTGRARCRDRQVRAGAASQEGGITLSGGEPMVQRRFHAGIFRRCKELGLHTGLDTSGLLGDRTPTRMI